MKLEYQEDLIPYYSGLLLVIAVDDQDQQYLIQLVNFDRNPEVHRAIRLPESVDMTQMSSQKCQELGQLFEVNYNYVVYWYEEPRGLQLPGTLYQEVV